VPCALKIKKPLKSGVTKGKSARKFGIAPGGMRYYPAFGVKSRLVAPFGRFFGV
jgi:hypothetical protein